MNITNIIEQESNVQLVISAADLKELVLEWASEKESMIQAMKADVHLLPTEVCKLLGVSKPTLWRWKKLGYLVPFNVGRRTYYKKSDVDRILQQNNVA